MMISRLKMRLKHILVEEPTSWAELLLGMIKFCLGTSLLWYLWDPPNSTSALPVSQAAMIGGAIFVLGLSQMVAVLAEWRWIRFGLCCAATGMWLYLMGSQWAAANSIRPILVYIPLLIFNMVVGTRILRPVRKPNDRPGVF